MRQNKFGDISDVPWRERLSSWLHRVPEKQTPPLSADDIEVLLPLAVDDALAGKNVIDRYPKLFQAMIDDNYLAEQFISALELLEVGELTEELPAPVPLDLEAIRKMPTRAQRTMDVARRWRLRWKAVQEELTAELFPANRALPVLRGSDTGTTSPIFQRTETIDHTEIDVAVIIEQTDADADRATVTLIASSEPPLQDRYIHATVRWGEYEASGRVDPFGLLDLPPITLSSVLDIQQKIVHAHLDVALALNDPE